MLHLADSLYPPALKAAGIGGTVVVRFAVLPSGAVDSSSVHVLDARGSDEPLRPELAAASAVMVRQLQFAPGIREGDPVRPHVRMAITWLPD
jgi:TonB family protein